MIGKDIRLERLVDRNSGRTVIVPMDHGITMGPIAGLTDMKNTINDVVSGGANAIVVHKGIVRAGHRRGGKDVGLIVHLSASTTMGPDPNAKIQVCEVEEAIKLGADGVSIHVNLGAPTESQMLRHFGQIGKECMEWGMPLFAMMYTRGPKVADQFDAKYVKHAARVGAELGADVVKCVYTGDSESFAEVVAGCPVPVVIAGGEKTETDQDLFEMIAGALAAGASGVSIGRNVFQHAATMKIVAAIGRMVHNNATPEEAHELLK